jgi:GWxTD domain-containing protein
VAAPAPDAGAVTRLEGPPPWRIGGRTGFTCDAAAFPDSIGYHLEVYLRVPPATLEQLALDEAGEAHLRATVSVRSRGRAPVESSREFAVAPDDTARGQGRVVLFRFPIAPGPCRLQARLEDLLSHKRGIVYSGRGVAEQTEIRGDLEVPRPQAGRDLSDIEFTWPESVRSPGLEFVRDGRAWVPNPDRLYGLHAGTLEAAFRARGKPGDARAWRWVVRVLDPADGVVAQHESTLVAGRFARGSVRFDVSDQPAGAYQLDVRLWQEGDAGALQRRARFSVAWEPGTWSRNAADIADDVHFLLEARDEERFPAMQPGEQERLLDEFWRRRDPSPETAVNEAYETFRERVAHANREFSRHGIGKGMFSDMGRVYIRYGQPTDLLHQVMPAGDETLTRVLEEIVRHEDRALGSVNLKGPGGDQRPYEVWIYEGDIPVPVDVEPTEGMERLSRRRLLFLFVDEQGLGTYTLRYSTE